MKSHNFTPHLSIPGAFAVAAVYVAAAASPSVVTSGNAINFWQLNAPIIYSVGGILGLFALSYYFSRRDEIQQRVSSNLSQWSQGRFHGKCIPWMVHSYYEGGDA